ncbi:gephyrin-like molybdotransferase Glp [Holophaga foetida]|uniref:molybdopterin molybdotransferase MoeA n=1 Tax=Holophaga foetida TaxID=35839 RepID=UPI000247501B|nr:gephyrin-like molybdotransferase Glp [Holophaga foetida]
MTTYSEALGMILGAIPPLPVEQVPLSEAAGRALAEDILSRESIPPFNNSAMDGFAIRIEDLRPGLRMQVQGTLAAGQVPHHRVAPASAVRIMTGAPLPEGADTVVPLEHTLFGQDWVEFPNPVERGSNIRWAGDDIWPGARVLSAGTLLKPAAIGVLASLGVSEVPVRVRPRVVVMSTGNELVDVKQHPGPGQIRDSNNPGICSQVATFGAIPCPLPRVPDKRERVHAAIQKAMETCDILLTTGGVSEGDFDFIKPVLEELGAQQVFWKVAQKPGGPFGFWTLNGKPIFGIPGNPVSAMVMVEEYVRPALRQMMGFKDCLRPMRKAILDEDWKKPRPDGKTHFLRVMLQEQEDGLHARLTGSQSSGVLTSMLLANGLAVVEADILELKRGDFIPVQMTEQAEDH